MNLEILWSIVALVFFGIWGYALNRWGFLIGLSVGWIPAGIGALVLMAVFAEVFKV